MVGEGAGILVRRALTAAGLGADTPGALPAFLEIYDRRLLDTTIAYDGVADMLLLASRHATLSVVTNKPGAPSQRILDGLGLAGYFEVLLGGDSAHGRKPNPAGLRAAAAPAAHVMLVGDSPIDYETAEAADAVFVWARYGFGAQRFGEPPPTPYVLDRPSDFAAVLDRFVAMTSGA